MSKRQRIERAIKNGVPKWNPPLPPPEFHNPEIERPAIPLMTNHDPRAELKLPVDVTTGEQVDTVNYLLALMSLNAEDAAKYTRNGVVMKNPVPPLVTEGNIGDATGYTDPRRLFAFGYHTRPLPGSAPSGWQALALPNLTVTGMTSPTEFTLENVSHLLGATYRLDCQYSSTRLRYCGPNQSRLPGCERSQVTWSAGSDYCFTDYREGWDTIIAAGTFDATTVQLSAWRGSSRVWVGFAYANPLPNCAHVWSGMAGFEGEPFAIFRDQVLTGKMPSRVYVEWLGENYRFPNCLKADAARCGFTLERN